MASSSIRFDLPVPDSESQEFWDAARRGQLLLKRCRACRRAHFYPRPFCPYCWSSEVAWEQASGKARLYTYSVVHENDLPPFRDQVPYVAAIVELEEGPRMMTRVVGVEPDALEVGMELEVAFEPIGEGFSVPVFRAA